MSIPLKQNKYSHCNLFYHIPLMHEKNWEEKVKNSIKQAARAFAIVYGTRQGISLILDVIRNKPLHLIYYKSSLQSATFISWYAFVYTLLRDSGSKVNTFLAGALAGLGIYFESRSNRLMLVQQTAVRSLNGLYITLVNQGYRKIPYVYEFIFSLSSASVMYTFVMFSSTLPKSLLKFMQNMSNTPTKMLVFIRDILNRSPINLIELNEWLIKKKASSLALQETQRLINTASTPTEAQLSYLPIQIQHYQTNSSLYYIIYLFGRTFKKILPVYTGLHVFPRMFLSFKSFINK